MGSNPIADMMWLESHVKGRRKLALSKITQVRLPERHRLLARRHTERKETKGTRGLPERHAFS